VSASSALLVAPASDTKAWNNPHPGFTFGRLEAPNLDPTGPSAVDKHLALSATKAAATPASSYGLSSSNSGGGVGRGLSVFAAAANDDMSEDEIDEISDELDQEEHALALHARAAKKGSQSASSSSSSSTHRGPRSPHAHGEGLGYATKSAMSVQPLRDGDAPLVAKLRRAAARRGDEAVSGLKRCTHAYIQKD